MFPEASAKALLWVMLPRYSVRCEEVTRLPKAAWVLLKQPTMLW